MRLVVCLLLVSLIPLSAATIDLSVSCSSAPTGGGPYSASCAGPNDSASATVNFDGLVVDANASADPNGNSLATVSFTEDLELTFFGGTGEGFAEPWMSLSFSFGFESDSAASATMGGCQVITTSLPVCPWNSVPFVFGVPETVGLTLIAEAAAFGGMVPAAADAEAAFDGFRGFSDPDGNGLSGVTYQISLVGAPVPEPSTLLLTAIAGAALLACAWHKRPQSGRR
jgi:hypothetical protein